MTIPMARTLTIIAENKVFSYTSLWSNRLFEYENNLFFKTIMNNRILWNLLYQLQLSLLLQQSFLLLCLCLIRQMALVWKNEWKTGISMPVWLPNMSSIKAKARGILWKKHCS